MFRRKSSGSSPKVPRTKLRLFNNGLTIIILGLSAYIIVLPFLPYFSLWWNQANDSTNGYRYTGQLAENSGQSTPDLAAPPEENTLVIPSIGVDQTVIEGETIDVLSADGVWRRPHTSTPDQGGNTVIIAHRFSYNSPATFYHLDKVEVGQQFAVWWQEKEYVYEVFNVAVVEPSAIEIEEPTAEPILTLYTCTPVWTAAQRLVVQARLVNQEVLASQTEGDPVL